MKAKFTPTVAAAVIGVALATISVNGQPKGKQVAVKGEVVDL